MKIFAAAALILGIVPVAMAGPGGVQIEDDLKPRLSKGTQFFFPSDKNWQTETTQRWNTNNPPTYVISIKPTDETDIQKIIAFAQRRSVPFLATGGGHGFASTLSQIKNGIEIDLSSFNQVQVDSNANTVTVGGSVRFSVVENALQAAGKEVPVGNCNCVGMMGATLGAGVGPYTGLHGFLLDSVISFRMVTGSGQILTVSATENPDLFWGMKGAGYNFGVVTSAVYRIYDATNGGNAVNADMIFPTTMAQGVWQTVAQVAKNQDKALSLDVGVAYNAQFGAVAMVLNANYFGSIDQANTTLKPFLDMNPLNVNITSVPAPELSEVSVYGAIAAGCVAQPVTDYGVNMFDVDVPTLVGATQFMATTMPKTPALQKSILAVQSFGLAGVQQFPDNSAAYPFRETVLYAQIDGFLANPGDASTVDPWAKQLRSLLTAGAGTPPNYGIPPGTPAVYINFAHGDEGPAAYYSQGNIPRLQGLKKQYDPNNQFSYFNPIPQ